MQLHVPGAFEFLENHLVHFAPGIDEALARIVRLPPSSQLRAEPKNFFGLRSAFASTPPDMVGLCRAEVNYSRARAA